MSAHPFAPGDRFRALPRGDAYDGVLGVVRTVWTSPETGEHHVHGWTDDGRYTMWQCDRIEHADEPHAADCLCQPCDEARWGLATTDDDEEPPQPSLADEIIASGVFTDNEAFTLAGVAYAADREGDDPEAAVADLVRAWDYGEASA